MGVASIPPRGWNALFSRRPEPSLTDDHFRALLESLPAAAYTCDAHGLITYHNERATAVWGREPSLLDPSDRFCGSFKLFTRKGERVTHDKCWMALALIERRAFIGQEIVIERRNGARVTVLAHASPFFDAKGELLGAVNILVDITERRAIEEEHARLQEQRAHSQKLESLGVLAGGIAHEFNNVLAVILGNVQLAQRSLGPFEGAEELLHHLDEMERASLHARDLVRQMLTFSRRDPPKPRMLSLERVVRDSLALVRATLPKSVDLHCRVSAEMPTVLADEMHLKQVVINLCTNAWHALEGRPGRIDIDIDAVVLEPSQARSIGAVPAPQHARIRVRDSGAGVDAAIMDRLFEPFFTTKPPGVGTGLGLSVVHSIVQGVGGCIEVQSQLGHGSTFTIHLPLHAELASVAPQQQP